MGGEEQLICRCSSDYSILGDKHNSNWEVD